MLFQFSSPAGWDNDKKMAILQENMSSFNPNEYFNEVIQKPVVTRKVRTLASIW